MDAPHASTDTFDGPDGLVAEDPTGRDLREVPFRMRRSKPQMVVT
jgi:hypothetical protein